MLVTIPGRLRYSPARRPSSPSGRAIRDRSTAEGIGLLDKLKTLSLRGIKDSPPHFHDGRRLILEDTIEFFNLIFGLKPGDGENPDIVAFLRQL